jgi:hypothetical protein
MDGGVRLTRWAIALDGVVHSARPLSAEAVCHAYDALRQDPEAEAAILFRLLRQAFPLRWSALWKGDVTRRILASPERYALLATFLKIAPDRVIPEREQDDWDRLEAMQRGEEEPGPEISLETICRLVEAHFGSSWYFNPDRWPTWDGYAPLDVVWRAWETLRRVRAFDRVNLVRAISMTKSEKSQQLYSNDLAEALHG